MKFLNWLFNGLSFGDWTWYPSPWRVNERVTGVTRRMSLWLRRRGKVTRKDLYDG